MNTKRNWVNDVLDRATRTTQSWPDWMRRPEFQTMAPSAAKLGSREEQIDKTEQTESYLAKRDE